MIRFDTFHASYDILNAPTRNQDKLLVVNNVPKEKSGEILIFNADTDKRYLLTQAEKDKAPKKHLFLKFMQEQFTQNTNPKADNYRV